MSKSKVKNLTGAILALGIAIGARAASAETLSALSYVTNGLNAWFDGIENVSLGGAHDTTATSWTDLSGNGRTFSFATLDGWGFGETGLTVTRATGVNLAGSHAAFKTAFQAGTWTADVAYNKTTKTPASSQGWTNTVCRFLSLSQAGNMNAYMIATSGDTAIGGNPNWWGENSNPVSWWEDKPYFTGTVSTTMGQHVFSCRQNVNSFQGYFDGAALFTQTVNPRATADSSGLRFNRSFYTDDGLDGQYYAIRVYARTLSADEVAVNQAVDRVRFFGVDSATLTLPSGYRFVKGADKTVLEHTKHVRVSDVAGGTVSVNGGAATTDEALWMPMNCASTSNITVTATAAAGCKFLGWSDAVPEAQRVNPTISIAFGATDVVAIFQVPGGAPRAYTWQGINGNLDDYRNWLDADGNNGLPVAGDSITVPAGKSISLGTTTERFAGVTIAGTLAITNWTTALNADAVTVANGGTLTCGAATTNENALTRVWVTCRDFTVATGGKVDVAKRGYAPWTYSKGGATYLGYGPGGSRWSAGASHGGFGATAVGRSSPTLNVLPYDDVREPTLPGSSGKSSWDYGSAGGGAVLVEATGIVTVNGTIAADGENSRARGCSARYAGCSAGSGGSVLIKSHTFAGTGGVITAKGGDGGDCTNSYADETPGAGGAIAIHYDAAAQAAVESVQVKLSAECGYWWGGSAATQFTAHNADERGMEADIGTLWFTDDTLLKALLPYSLTGQIASPGDTLTLDALTMTEGNVRFIRDGFTLNVTGDLTLSGAKTRLDFGGATPTNRHHRTYLLTKKPITVNVGGNLSVASGARFDIRAAEKSDVSAGGATVSVGGTMTVGADAVVYAWCDSVTGTHPAFTVGDLAVEANGLLSAKGRGFAGGHQSDKFLIRHSAGYGSVGGTYKNPKMWDVWPRLLGGGGHGGAGGGFTTCAVRGEADADDVRAPVLPGSGGAAGAYSFCGGAGGGVIDVTATNSIVVNGEVNADGATLYSYSASYIWETAAAGGAGGTVRLTAPIVSGAATGKVSARGGDGFSHPASGTKDSGMGGGGGRVAIWTGKPYTKGSPLARHTATSAQSGTGAENFLCAIDVAGGASTVPGFATLEAAGATAAEVGTVRFVDVVGGGFLIYVR